MLCSPYAQPREQTFLQRVDVAGSERILQEDLLTKGKDAHNSSAFRAKMGYNPKGSVTSGSSVINSSSDSIVSHESI